ncbi:hypothetical protein D9756_009622 [Leucocoprinus leucothites]|uniref:GST N-terminal domain-containing protein n=1 Tax=Leucocoprinus leucothites TaxID=201217 RepID=A0A8H5FSZ4_9AGAR|nr:hypothetical protein D9756_009622 [Leucoagaricus leucothites]
MASAFIFFDIPCKKSDKRWSLNTWKTRYTLHYKGLSYETQWVEYPHIEEACKKNGIPPLRKKPDGVSPHYTCPSLVDKSTGAALTDSVQIAQYLDKTYPHTPRVFPNDSDGLQFAFAELHDQRLAPGWPLIFPAVAKILNPPSAEYFYRTRTQAFGKPLEELIKSEEERVETMKKFKGLWDALEAWYSKTDGPFLMGEVISFADFVVASDVKFVLAAWGEGSVNWREFATWHGGKWVRLTEEVDKACGISG